MAEGRYFLALCPPSSVAQNMLTKVDNHIDVRRIARSHLI